MDLPLLAGQTARAKEAPSGRPMVLSAGIKRAAHQPRLSPEFSGRENSYWTDALAPPSPADVSYVAASWKASRSSTGACTCFITKFFST